MNPGQSRVTILLLILLAFEAVKQPPIKAAIANLVNGVSGNLNAKASGGATQPLQVNFKQMAYWGVGALALIALAGPAPDVATWLVIILLMLVVLSDVNLFTGLLAMPGSKKQ